MALSTIGSTGPCSPFRGSSRARKRHATSVSFTGVAAFDRRCACTNPVGPLETSFVGALGPGSEMAGVVRRLALLVVAALLGACGVQAVSSTAGETTTPSDATTAVIAHYREEIPRLMKEQGVPGISVAVVDDHGIVWSAGFGVTDTDDPDPVTPDTIFSVQSTSKAFTATAVLLAVEDGLVDLDTPITTYLPDFSVHSIFEDHPESRITLRYLLSHTAGFTHEAPVGNNWDLDADSFDAHIRSISDTWLRFPVGSGYAYSNLGIDLAGYILEAVSGQPFADYVPRPGVRTAGDAEQLLRCRRHRGRRPARHRPRPGLTRRVPASADGARRRDVRQRQRPQPVPPVPARRRRRWTDAPFSIRPCSTRCAPCSSPKGMDATAMAWEWGAPAGTEERNADLFSHGGGGFGFTSDLCWLPELQLGIAVLFNSADHDLRDHSGARHPRRPGTHAGPPPATGFSRCRPTAPWERGLGRFSSATHPRRRHSGRGGPAARPDPLAIVPWRLPDRQRGACSTSAHRPAGSTSRTRPPVPRRERHRGRDVSPPRGGARGVLHRDWRGPRPPCAAPHVPRPPVHPSRPRPSTRGLGAARDVRPRDARGGDPVAASAPRACASAPADRTDCTRIRRHHRPSGGQHAAVAVSVSGLASIAMVAVLPHVIYTGYVGWLDLATWQEWLRAPLALALSTVALAALTTNWRHAQRTGQQHWVRPTLIAAALMRIALLASWHLIGLS